MSASQQAAPETDVYGWKQQLPAVQEGLENTCRVE